jgi:adhesin transport system outer membrane protein
VLEKLRNYRAVLQDLTVAKAKYYPQLQLRSAAGREQKNSPSTNFKDVTSTVQEHSLTLTQNLFDGFGTYHKVRAEEQRVQMEAYRYFEQANNTIMDIAEKYINVIRRNALLEITGRSIVNYERMVKKIEKKYDSGVVTLSEAKKIRARLSLTKSNYVTEQTNFLDAMFQFNKLVGRAVSVETLVEPSLIVELPRSYEDTVTIAMRNNPTIIMANLEVESKKSEVSEKFKTFLPSLDVEVTKSWNKNLSATEGTDEGLKSMLVMNYNLFNGGVDNALHQQQISRVHESQERLRETTRQTIQSLQQSWSSYHLMQDQLQHLEAYYNNSVDTLDLYEKEFDLGRKTLLDLLNAEDDLNAAESKLVNIRSDMFLAKLRTINSMGILAYKLGVHITLDPRQESQVLDSDQSYKDFLPINHDQDKDSVDESRDQCPNSVGERVDATGCSQTYDSYALALKDKEEILLDEVNDFLLNTPVQQNRAETLENSNELSLELLIDAVSQPVATPVKSRSDAIAQQDVDALLDQLFTSSTQSGLNKSQLKKPREVKKVAQTVEKQSGNSIIDQAYNQPVILPISYEGSTTLLTQESVRHIEKLATIIVRKGSFVTLFAYADMEQTNSYRKWSTTRQLAALERAFSQAGVNSSKIKTVAITEPTEQSDGKPKIELKLN